MIPTSSETRPELRIDGSTRLIAIIGDPIDQVRAPAVWSALFSRNGINAICIPLHVAPADLPRAIDGLRTTRNIGGAIITVPHKRAATGLVEHLSPEAERVGAVNAIRPEADGAWSGDIFDGLGFVAGCDAAGRDLAGRRVLLVGSGGVGTAIAWALLDRGIAQLTICDVDSRLAEMLAGKLQAAYPLSRIVIGSNDPAGQDMVINATPIGMRPDDPVPVLYQNLRSNMLVADVIMKPPETRLLREASERGCAIQVGAAMMDHSIALMARFFRMADGDWSAHTIKALGL